MRCRTNEHPHETSGEQRLAVDLFLAGWNLRIDAYREQKNLFVLLLAGSGV